MVARLRGEQRQIVQQYVWAISGALATPEGCTARPAAQPPGVTVRLCGVQPQIVQQHREATTAATPEGCTAY